MDLELETEKVSKVMYNREDLAGGTIFLPYFRINFPWIPVICISRLFDHKESSYFSSVAGSYGFDGYLHKDSLYETVKESKINKEEKNRDNSLQNCELIDTKLFNTIINNAKEHRICYQTDYSYTKHTNQLKIEVQNKIKTLLNSAEYSEWRELLKIAFFPFNKIEIEPISGGYSGALTFRITARISKMNEQSESAWLLKLSNRPDKLHQEIINHYSFQRSGLPYARSVQLLWRGVVEIFNISCIIYKFAEGTDTLSNILTVNKNTKEELIKLKSLFGTIYNKEKRKTNRLIALEPINLLQEPDKVIDSLKENRINLKVLSEIKNSFFDEFVEYTSCWIHGDLHTKNILIGERNVLIDFARACIGPFVYDIAKFSCDLLYHIDEYRETDILFLSKNTKMKDIISELFNINELTEGDRLLFRIFVIFELASCLYKDYDDENRLKKFRKWITKFLKSITINQKQLVIKK